MDASLTPFLEVRLHYAVRHCWPAQAGPFQSSPSHYTLWAIEEGGVQIECDGQSWELVSGALLLMPMRQRSVTAVVDSRWLSIAFVPSLFGKVDPLQVLQAPLLFESNSPQKEPIFALMQQLVGYWMRRSPIEVVTPEIMGGRWPEVTQMSANQSAAEALICQGFIRSLYGLCWQQMEARRSAVELESELPPWLSQCLALIRSKPETSISGLAHDVGFSASQLRRAFHEWLGVSPQQYLFAYRMEQARHLLETTDWPIHEIAHHLGFRSAPTFTRVFKENFHVPPAQYRQDSRPQSVAHVTLMRMRSQE
jgi:AraC-like DNA-binding protein